MNDRPNNYVTDSLIRLPFIDSGATESNNTGEYISESCHVKKLVGDTFL